MIIQQLLDQGAVRPPGVIYIEERLQQNIDCYSAIAKASGSQLRYAVKACPLRRVLECLATAGWGADCQSVLEATLAERAGIASNRLSLCTPKLATADLDWALARPLTLIADSESQLAAVHSRLSAGQVHPDLVLGVRFSATTSATARFHSKLGMEPERILHSFKSLPLLQPRLRELHHHGMARETSSDILNIVTAEMAQFSLELEKKTQVRLQRLNLGGGLEPESILREHGTSTRTILDEAFNIIRTHAQSRPWSFVLEPGRAVVKDAAFGLATVVNLKEIRGTQVAVIDLATNLLIPLPLAAFRVLPVKKSDSLSQLRYDVVDGTCSPAGVIARATLLPQLSAGDHLIIEHVGGYTWSLAEPFFDLLPPLYWLDVDKKLTCLFTQADAREWVNHIWGYHQ